MRKKFARAAAAAMAGIMALGLSSCGEKEEVYASKEHIFTAEQVQLPEGGVDYISKLLYRDEKLYIVGDKSWTEGEGDDAVYKSETKMQIVTLDGTLEKEITLSGDDEDSTEQNGEQNENTSHYVSIKTMDNEGNIIGVENSYKWDMTTYETLEEKYFLKKYDSEGNLVSTTDLQKLLDAAEKDSSDSSFYIDDILCTDDGNLIIYGNSRAYVTDGEGNLISRITVPESSNANEDIWMGGIYQTGDGRIVMGVSTSRMVGDEYTSEQKLYEVNTATGELGTEYPFSMNAGTIMSGNDQYDLLISKDSGLVGYDIETQTSETIIDWLKSGFDNTAMEENCTTVLQDGRILCVTHDYKFYGSGGYGWGGNDLLVNILTAADTATLPDKKLIKLYSIYLDIGVKRQILEFNKTNLEYEIEFTDYSEYATNSYDDAVTKLNNDMIAGNLPDIIVLDQGLNADSYISKGLLADLYQFMDNDETINRSDFVESAFAAEETDGKLYKLPTYFQINTIVGKTSDVGETQGWTMDELIALADANPDKSVFGDFTKDNVLYNLICFGGNSYINRETGECSFNSEGFIKLLEFANRFPKELDDSRYEDDNYWMDYDTQYRDGRTLLNLTNIGRFIQLREFEKASFGEQITFKGIPGAEGNGSAFNFNGSELAITSKAANPEGAWQFIKYFLSEEYQDLYASQDNYSFPVRKSSLEKKAANAKERPYWEDENGEKQYYDNNYYIGNETINIGICTDEDIQRVMDLINSTTAVYKYEPDVTEIISEEAAAYFEGQKSAQEVADIIQNRVSTYIAESR